jgi:AAA+ ATPase superfamily predicted ATPase
MKYKQDVAFINRERELAYLASFIDKRPNEILFLHGPKSSGKTTLLYKFFDGIQREQKLDVKFVNLREILIINYKDFLKVFFGLDYSQSKGDVKEIREYNFRVFKVKVEVLKGLDAGEIDPFSVMKKELVKLNGKNIKPVIIIDELQALDHIYVNGQRELITELFNFFVAMTKESHLAHVIISSSDGYFVDTVYKDSRLKKTSSFFRVDYLSKEDVCEWLENLEKYSKITDYRLTRSDIEKIWDVVGGSMWEIQKILTDLFTTDLDSVLNEYKKFMRGIIDDYIGFSSEKETILRLFSEHAAWGRQDLRSKIGLASEEVEEVLHDLVFANILYYDPTKAVFYSQGKSMDWGIKLYFDK